MTCCITHLIYIFHFHSKNLNAIQTVDWNADEMEAIIFTKTNVWHAEQRDCVPISIAECSGNYIYDNKNQMNNVNQRVAIKSWMAFSANIFLDKWDAALIMWTAEAITKFNGNIFHPSQRDSVIWWNDKNWNKNVSICNGCHCTLIVKTVLFGAAAIIPVAGVRCAYFNHYYKIVQMLWWTIKMIIFALNAPTPNVYWKLSTFCRFDKTLVRQAIVIGSKQWKWIFEEQKSNHHNT